MGGSNAPPMRPRRALWTTLCLLLALAVGAPALADTATPTRLGEQVAVARDMARALGLVQAGRKAEALELFLSCRQRAHAVERFPGAAPGSWQALFNENVRAAELNAASSAQTCLVDLGRFEEGLALGREVLAAVDARRQPLLAARSHHAIADALRGLLEYEKSLREAQQALQAASLFVQEMPARLAAWQRLTAIDAASAAQIREYYEAAAEVRQLMMKSCALLELLGRYEEALATYEGPAWRALMDRLDDPQVLELLRRALADLFGKQTGDAMLELYRGLNVQQSYNAQSSISYCWRCIASESGHPEDWDKALVPLQAAQRLLAAHPELGAIPEATLQGAFGNAWAGQRHWKEAREALQRCLRLAEKVHPQYREELEVTALVSLIRVLVRQQPHDVAGAARLVTQADALMKKRPADDLTWRLADLRGQVRELQGNRAAALAAYREAVRLIERERVGIDSPELKETFFRGRQSVYENLIRLLHDMSRDDEALAVMERVRARSLLDMLRSVSIEKGLSAPVASALRDVDRREVALRVDRNRAEAVGQASPVLRDQEAELELQRTRTYADVLKESPELASLRNAEPLPASAIRRLLDRDTVLLEYLVGDHFNAVVVLKSDGPSVMIPLRSGMAEMRAEVSRLRRALRRPGGEAWRAPAEKLYRILIAPVETHIAGRRRLLIVPYDQLNYLPWAVLRHGPKCLVDDHAIVLLPSASVLHFCRARTRSAGRHLVAFALGESSAGTAPPLPATREEAAGIARLFPDHAVVTESAFTLQAVREQSPHAAVLHFATHGVLDAANPTESGVLATDGKLAMRDIFNLPLQARLVVLSACETGLGQLYRGDEMVGLTRAFMYAGTPSVLGTLWSVADQSTADFMQAYYNALGNVDKAAALRAAQLTLRRRYPHPFFWAPFVLQGDWK